MAVYLSHIAAALCLLVLTAFAYPAPSTLNDELLTIDAQLQDAKTELVDAMTQMRGAKQAVDEKQRELVEHQAAHASSPSDFHAYQVHYAQQRLALARLGLDHTAARFERISQRMEELATARISLLSSRDNKSAPQVPPAATTSSVEQRKRPPQPRKQVAEAAPVLSVHGKLVDPVAIEAELQKLERHLVTAEASGEPVRQVKAYGSTIAGEVVLSSLGANQFFARFTATEPKSLVVVGARLKQYLRTAVDLEFAEHEIGNEFVLILDINQPQRPRVLVFQSGLVGDREAIAAHQLF